MLSSSCVLCPILPVSLGCPFFVLFVFLLCLVPNIACVSGLSIQPKGQSRTDNPETLVTFGTQETGQRLEKTEGSIKNGQSRDTGNIWYTRNSTKVRENWRVNQVNEERNISILSFLCSFFVDNCLSLCPLYASVIVLSVLLYASVIVLSFNIYPW
jgi:hypothetical protein